MRYNYYYLCLYVLFLLGLVTSCSNDIDYTYKGSNYIQISTADDPAIAENDDRPVTVDVLLATAVETDATIHFELSGNEDGVLNMENDGSVLIKAGEKKASFKIASNHKGLIKAQRSMTLKVKDYTDPRMQAWRDLKLIVKPSVESPTLTEEQLELIKGYKEKYGLDDKAFDKQDIHIHVPEGAIKKDGPSAGVTLTTAIYSAFTNKPVRDDVAMTGEITLRGNVLPIGGLKEKSISAHRSGIRKIIIPKENEKDIEDIPESVRNDLEIVLADHIDTVLEHAIVK